MKIRYQLKKKSNGYLVYIALYEKDLTEIISTGQRCQLTEWDTKNNVPKQGTDLFTDVLKVNNAIIDIKKLMDAKKEPITPWTLKDAYQKSLKGQTEQQYEKDKNDKTTLVTVTSTVEDYTTHGLNKYKEETRKSIKDSLSVFTDFLKSTVGLSSLQRRDLNLRIFQAYERHLTVKKKYADSTHGRCIKHFRWYLGYLKFDKNIIEELKIRRPKKSERNIISLTFEELTALENVDVSHDLELQRAKDMFLLGCYTGLRISDLKRIQKPLIKNNSISMTLRKNRTLVHIPIIAKANEILARYNYTAPKISALLVNSGIKTVCDKAEIREEIVFKTLRDGKLIETVHQKFTKITSHCAGKTFISLANTKWGLTAAEVAAIVGKDVRTVLDYYKDETSDLQIARSKMIEVESRQLMKAV